MKNKPLASLVIIVVLLVSSLAFNSNYFGKVNASTNVNTTITSDTTWTKANSPYSLSAPTMVNIGVSLTIEPGVIVDLNGYYIIVNGTLRAIGSAEEKVYFNGGSISFTPTSRDSVIENVVLSYNGSILVTNSSPKIAYSSIDSIDVWDGSPEISFNTITSGINIYDGSPSIFNNDIRGRLRVFWGAPSISNNVINGSFYIYRGEPSITNNTIDARIVVENGPTTISNNKISDGVHADARGGPITITNNEINSKSGFPLILVLGVHADISGNKIFGNNATGISVNLRISSASIANNQIQGCGIGIHADAGADAGDVQIVGNLIINNTVGIHVWAKGDVHDNTIAENSIGIQCAASSDLIISHNNFLNNSKYNLEILHLQDLNAIYNWWGEQPTLH